MMLLKGDNELGAVCSKLGCLFYIYIQVFTGHRESASSNALKKIFLLVVLIDVFLSDLV